MPGLHLYKSNRLENLATALIEVTTQPLSHPLTPETIVVQSLGMGRWLAQSLAQSSGVALNVRFPFPAAFADSLFPNPTPTAESPFSTSLLPWRILAALPALLPLPAFTDLLSYCSGDNAPLKSFQISRRIASTFDRYLAYRPELLLRWQSGHDLHWQAILWRHLTHSQPLLPSLTQANLESLRLGSIPTHLIPERVSIFGISSLPPIHIALLRSLSPHTDLHLFLLEPSNEFYAEIASPKEVNRRSKLLANLHALPDDQVPPFIGHPLLSSLGKTGRDFAWLLLDQLEPDSETDLFSTPSPTSLLSHLQSDIFSLSSESLEPPLPLPPNDRSLQIHAAHSPIRELEVLHDQLLQLFIDHPKLAPRDILVSIPDLESYAPLIDAVFGAPESPNLHIPYTIADRSLSRENLLADSFLHCLDLAGSRFPASAVLALLDSPPIRSQFQLSDEDLPLIHQWVEATNIRWGIDAHHRASFGFTPFPENAWRTGLSQLLLGYALPGDSATLFSSILPHPHIEGQLAQTLGHFVHFTEQLFLHTSNLSSPRPLATWSLDLRATLLALFSSDDSFADDLRPVTNAILSLSKIASLADLDSPIPFPIIRAALADAFADSQSSRGFLAGSVTFSGLKPMRSIPFPVICLLGLNDGAFPRRDHPSSFDLIASQPRRGDRSLRDDDRYLFLESILSARQFLYLSYTGISTKDNSDLPPSVLVTELFEHLKSRFSLPDDFITKHKLQAFNSAYFNHSHPQLFSFSTENATTAQKAARQRSLPPPFIPHPLPAPPEETLHIHLTQLLKFFANPSKFFLEESLHLRLPSPDSPPHDSEPSSLNHLEKYKLRDDLASRSLANGHLSADLAVASASGQLPIGYAGASAYDAITQEVATLLARISTPFAETILPPIPVDLSLGRFHLTGSLPNLRPSGLFAYRVGSLRPVDKITAWISHLILQFVAPPHHPRISTFFAKKDEISFAPVPLPEPPLLSLLEAFASGSLAPLPFFPRSSFAYAEDLHEPTRAIVSALKCWEPTYQNTGQPPSESEDPHFQLAFRGSEDPLNQDFQSTASELLAPLLKAISTPTPPADDQP